jgi:hypothetical protein
VADQTPTPAQLRNDAVRVRMYAPSALASHAASVRASFFRAAAALEEQAARMEREPLPWREQIQLPESDHVQRIKRWMGGVATETTDQQIEAAWQEYSTALCASWLLDGDDMRGGFAGWLLHRLLHEQAARLERPTTELRGWGVMRPDGTLMACVYDDSYAEMKADQDAYLLTGQLGGAHRAVPVRLVLDDTQSAADAQEGENDGN